ncbi:MAG: VOC family protein [Pseudomonadota bacterium]
MITLGVRDLSRACAFYEALGLRKAEERLPGIAFYQLPGLILSLFPIDELAEDQGRTGADLGTGAASLTLSLPDRAAVDHAYATALAAGGTGQKPPNEAFWGGYSGYVLDPDGHPWEFAHSPLVHPKHDRAMAGAL